MRRPCAIQLRRTLSAALLLCCCLAVQGQSFYPYSVPLAGCRSAETGGFPTAHLWIPEGCTRVRAAILAQQNMTEERILKLPAFRERMAAMGVAQVWVAPAFSHDWSPLTECQPLFEQMMRDLAAASGHPELAAAPIVPLGHSAQATFPWNFAAWNADRTLCIVSFHGDAPRTNLCGYGRENVEWGRTRNIDGIPGLMVEGEYEWWEARVNPALAFRMMYPASCISFLCDTGRGHFDCSEATALYIARFIEKSLHERLQADGSLRRLNPQEGWLAQRFGYNTGAQPAPCAAYEGDPHDAFWYFDEEMATEVYRRYAATAHKQPQFVGIRYRGRFIEPDNSQAGMSLCIDFGDEQDFCGEFELEPLYTDSTHLRESDSHGKARPRMEYICGPAIQTGDGSFRLYRHEAGSDNPRRSFTVWVCAVAPGDEKYKGCVQPLMIKIKR